MQILITAKSWPQREKFIARVTTLLQSHPATRPYYPGCPKSYATQCDALGGTDACAPSLSEVFPGQMRPFFKTNVTPTDAAFSLKTEAFCPVLLEIPLEVDVDPAIFLPAAVKFANEECWGNLSVTLIVDSRTQKKFSTVVNNAVDSLNYGTVGVNQAAMMAPMFGQTLWGAFPGNSPQNILSGAGKIGNAYGFVKPIKSILWAPFTYLGQSRVPTPSGQAKMYRLLSRYLIRPGMGRLLRLAANIVTGM